MQIATLCYEKVLRVSTFPAVSTPSFKDKYAITKVEATSNGNGSTTSSDNMIKSDNVNDNLLETTEEKQSISHGRGLEDRKRKHAPNMECIRTTRQQQQKDQVPSRNVLLKKTKSEVHQMSANSSNIKYLRSTMIDKFLLNTDNETTNTAENCEVTNGEESGSKADNRNERSDSNECINTADHESSPADCDNTNITDDSNDSAEKGNSFKYSNKNKEDAVEQEYLGNICHVKPDEEIDSDKGAYNANENEGEKFSSSAKQSCKHEARYMSDDESNSGEKAYHRTEELGRKQGESGDDYAGADYRIREEEPSSSSHYNQIQNDSFGNIGLILDRHQNLEKSALQPSEINDVNQKEEDLSCFNTKQKLSEYSNSKEIELQEADGRNDRNFNKMSERTSISHVNRKIPPAECYKYTQYNNQQQRGSEHEGCNKDECIENVHTISVSEKKLSEKDCSESTTNFSSCSAKHSAEKLLNTEDHDRTTYKEASIRSENFSIVNNLTAKNLNNNILEAYRNDTPWVKTGELYAECETLTHIHGDHAEEEGQKFDTEKEKCDLDLSYKIEKQERTLAPDQQQCCSIELGSSISQQGLGSYHPYLEQETGISKTIDNIKKHGQTIAPTMNVDTREPDLYQLNKELHQRKHQIRDKNTLCNTEVFSNMQHLEQHCMQQEEQHTYDQAVLCADTNKERQQQPHELQHSIANENDQHQHMQHFSQEQLFEFQQQQQLQQNSLHNLHHVLHNQIHSIGHLQQSLPQEQHLSLNPQHTQNPHQLQHQRHQDEHVHIMAYLHQENQHRQQQQQFQQAYHQQQQYEQQMHHESILLSSPHAHSNQQQHSSLSTTTSACKKSIHLPIIDELMIADYHDDHKAEYKLTLSPTNAKHENQDDGYETSAGDVLTPNSHTSSTHSMTPQHQIQHTGSLLAQTKRDQPMKPHHLQLSSANTDGIHSQQQTTHNPINTGIEQEILAENVTGSATADAYNFINDELNSAANLRVMSSPNGIPPNPSERNYMSLQETEPTLSNEDILSLGQHQQQGQQQQIQPTTTASSHQDFASNTSSAAISSLICNKGDEEQMMKDSINCCDSNKPPQKRRGRKKKIIVTENLPEGMQNNVSALPQQLNSVDEVAMAGSMIKAKERKKHDRFNGMSEDEVAKRILPDHLCDNLDIVIVGINPGLFAAYKGHHYAGPGNHFWKCLYLSGLTHEQMNAEEDYKLIKYSIGFTNMVQRATKGSADLTRKEIKEGSRILLEKLQRFRPKIAVFNGKLIFEVFSGKKDFNFGRQPECVDGTDTYIWVMPSSSARCAQLPRAADKVPFYAALKKFRDYLNGLIPNIDESECVFTEQKIKQCCEQENLKLLQSSGNNSLGVPEQNGGVMLYDAVANISENSSSTTQKATDQCLAQNNSNNNNDLQKKDSVNMLMQHQHYSNQQHSYLYGSEENVSTTSMSGHTPGPGPPNMTGIGDNRYMLSTCHNVHPPEKKKRGRPKKIKEGMSQDVIDPATGNKIHVTAQMQPGVNDFGNILNLSMMSRVGGEIPKKKRGRPKKVKLPTNMTHSSIEHRLPPCATNHTLPPQQHMLFNAAEPSNMQPQQHMVFNSSSPMRSPAMNCSYITVSPPGTQSTPPIQLHQQLRNNKHDGKLDSSDLGSAQQLVSDSNSSYYAEKILQTAESSPHQNHMQSKPITSSSTADLPPNDSHLEESAVGNSPNMAAVNFEPPNATGNSTNLDREISQHQLPLNQRLHEQNSRYGSPTDESSARGDASETFHQWLSPNHSQSVATHHYDQNRIHQQQAQQLIQYRDQQLHQIHQQHSQHNVALHSPWQKHQQHQRYEESSASYTRIMSHQLRQQHIVGTSDHHSQQQLSTDVTSKSLSGLESLVDQIPTNSESESVTSNSLSASTAAAVESRLQSIHGNKDGSLRSNNSEITETQSDLYGEQGPSHTPIGASNDNSEILPGGNSGSNTPHTANGMYGSGSPGNYSVHRLNSSASADSSPVSHVSLRSPHYQPQVQQQLQLDNQLRQQQHYAHTATDRLMNLLPPSTPTAVMNNSSSNTASTNTSPLSNNISGSTAGPGPSYGSSSSGNPQSNIHTSNFSVSHLAASSAAPPSSITNVNLNYPSPPTNHAAYHHSNLMAAASLAATAANSPSTGSDSPSLVNTHGHHVSSLPQMYMDPHAHLPVPVNTMYPHPHPQHHAHGYGPPAQHSPVTDYDTSPYGSPSAAAAAVQSNSQHSPAHTLHMPSPNYPYGYATPPTQSSYTSAIHAQSTPPLSGPVSAAAAAAAVAGYHHSHHHAHHHGHHTTHHLSMFERLKPSDLGGYGSF